MRTLTALVLTADRAWFAAEEWWEEMPPATRALLEQLRDYALGQSGLEWPTL